MPTIARAVKQASVSACPSAARPLSDDRRACLRPFRHLQTGRVHRNCGCQMRAVTDGINRVSYDPPPPVDYRDNRKSRRCGRCIGSVRRRQTVSRSAPFPQPGRWRPTSLRRIIQLPPFRRRWVRTPSGRAWAANCRCRPYRSGRRHRAGALPRRTGKDAPPCSVVAAQQPPDMA